MAQKIGTTSSLIGSFIAAIIASLCCVGPLLFITFGVGGAWVAQLTKFEAVRPFFILVSIALLGSAFYRLYLSPQACIPGAICAAPKTLKIHRIIFWTSSISLLGLIATPWIMSSFI
jgi:mercuric ion transport protein